MAVDYLSSVEQSVLDEINQARTNPSGYADILAQRRQYYQGNLFNFPGQVSRLTNEGVAALDEAISALRSTSPLPALSPSRGMSLAAKNHVNDIGPKGIDDMRAHTGSDGSNVSQRIDRYGDPQGFVGETIDFGANTGRQIAIDFLVDDGVPSRGHRDNLLKPSFQFAGVSVGAHAKDGTMAVIDFADGYKEASAPPTSPVPIPTPPPVPIAPPSNTGSDGNQTVLGTAGSDTLRGGSGTYILYGGKGDDVLLGSESNDGSVIYAYGGSGNDVLVDGFGNDILIGGKGDDYFIGTDGIDTFVGSSGNDTFAFVSDGLAIIPDFDPNSDFIELLDNLKGSRVLVTRNTSNSIGVFVSTNGGSSFDLNLALLTNYTGDLESVSRRIIGGAVS